MPRRTRPVEAGTAKKASDTKEPRGPHDGKDAKLGYDSDEPAKGTTMAPSGEEAGDFDYKTSKWQGSGQKARH